MGQPQAFFAIRGRLLLGASFDSGAIVIEGDRIADIRRGTIRDGDLPASVIDGDLITPGMIDLQVNGAIGREVSDVPADMEAISRWTATTGVTAWLPTVVTADEDFYKRVFASWPGIRTDVGATPLGLHLEGPFLSAARKGAHRLDLIEHATESIFQRFLEPDSVKLVTLAPDRDGAIDRIRRLVARGIIVSLGHTDATYETFRAGVDAGATKATHLFNTMSPIHHREPGAMVASLLDDRVTAGLIPDAIHSDPAMVRLALRTKGIDRIATVSDMMAACGLGPGRYPLSGREVTVEGMTAHLADGTLAGSVLSMDQAVRNLVEWGGLTFAEAMVTATQTPADVLRDWDRGRLVVGKRADITVWSNLFNVRRTIVGGETMFEAP